MIVLQGSNQVGTVFALVVNSNKGYAVYKHCSNYCCRAPGGITKTWRYVERNITYARAIDLYERRLRGKQQ